MQSAECEVEAEARGGNNSINTRNAGNGLQNGGAKLNRWAQLAKLTCVLNLPRTSRVSSSSGSWRA